MKLFTNISKFIRPNLFRNNNRFFNHEKIETRLKATFNCSKEYRDQFSQSKIQMTISVGQPVHEGERLLQTVRLINSATPQSVIIMLDDSIQHYTNQILSDKSPEEILTDSIQAGDQYLQRNFFTFQSNFNIPFEIVRWKDWLYTPSWIIAIESMRKDYQDNLGVQQAINSCADTFLQRYEKNHIQQIQKKGNKYDHSHAKKLCIDYLIEECGVMRLQWIKLGCHYELYPSGRNQAMEKTYQLYIKEKYPDLLKSVAVRFHRRHVVENNKLFQNDLPYNEEYEKNNMPVSLKM